MISKKKVLISIFVGLALVGSNLYQYNQNEELQNKLESRAQAIDTLDASVKYQYEYAKELQEELQKKDNEILELKDEVKKREAVEVSRGGGREIDVEVTFYTYTGNPTASGTMPRVGVTAACNFLALGSHVIINGHEYIIEDTGGMSGNVIDIFVDSEEEALQLGRQYTTATIL